MIILFDLDDTLLGNPMETFLPAYLHRLGQYLSEYYSPKDLPAAILNGTEKMINNVDPSRTLEECFDDYFYPVIGTGKEILEHKIKDFYKNEFPKLAPLTNEIPHAASIVKYLSEQDYKIVIATNPLFPKIAIDHRIKWANLEIDTDDFEYVTNFEELHFTKPRPEFVAEILGKIGWPDEPVVMIGNEWDMDILPAEILGIPTYYIGKPPEHSEITLHPLSSSGKMENVLDWISHLNLNNHELELSNTKEALLAILRATAANMDSFLRIQNLQARFSNRPKTDEWALVEIISHMADVDKDVNIPRIQMITKEDNPFIEAALTDQWADERDYIVNNPVKELSRFISNRVSLIEMIENLTPQQWNKSINHAIFGPTPTAELIKFIAQHDRIHIHQMVKTLESLPD
ncbi:MAG: HAD hydrolase-like protein [Anaerolineaceae bacterium]|nr:HAD hydrolase-like protein [Anaerolineaceae bacterium]